MMCKFIWWRIFKAVTYLELLNLLNENYHLFIHINIIFFLC